MKKKIVICLMIIAVISALCAVFVGCGKEYVTVYLEYQITDQFHSADSISIGNLLTKPSDPIFENSIFNCGIGGISGGYADFELPIENPRMGEGFDVNKDYIFIGWYKEPECIRPWNFAEDRVYKETTLYAKWIEKTW